MLFISKSGKMALVCNSGIGRLDCAVVQWMKWDKVGTIYGTILFSKIINIYVGNYYIGK